MANEITLTGSLTASKPSVMSSAIGRSVVGAQFNMGNLAWIEGVAPIGTAATLIPLGPVTQPHWAYFKNLDATNYLTIRNGAAGADLIKLLAGEMAFVPLLDTSVPYAVANVAACQLEYMVISL